MKRFFTCVALSLGIAFCAFAQEAPVGQNTGEGCSFGSFALIQSRKSGGGLTFAFPVFKSGDFFISNEITASAYTANTVDATLISLGDKIHFGKLVQSSAFKFRTYGYMKCEVGASRDSTYDFFAAPIILELGGAGGFEFIFWGNKGFFVEFGGGASIAGFGDVGKEDVAQGSLDGGYVCITTGYKHYF